MLQGVKVPGTFVPGNEHSGEQSFRDQRFHETFTSLQGAKVSQLELLFAGAKVLRYKKAKYPL